MCCRSKAKALRAQQMSLGNRSHLTGAMPPVASNRASNINALAGAVNNLILNPQHQQPHVYNPAPDYPKDVKLAENYPTEAPPAYEKVTGLVAPEVATREMTNSTLNTVQPHLYTPQRVELPPQFQSSPQISKLIEALTAALAAHQSGSGRHRDVRRAQKALRDDLYEGEIARRQAVYGKLRCGERSQIWREVKALNLGY